MTDDMTPAETSPAENQDASQVFRLGEFVHIGPGAEGCEGGPKGTCENPDHFHAFCRLPNNYQIASVREKALAAKARKARRMKDPESDAYAILENNLDLLRETASVESLVEDLMASSYLRDHLRAMREVGEEDEFKTIAEDRERLEHLESLPEGERDGDEVEELRRHTAAHREAVEKRREELVQPERDALVQLPKEQLVEKIRDLRIEVEAGEDFMRVYSLWQAYVGTLKPRASGRPRERVYADINDFIAEDTEIVEAIDEIFKRLEDRGGQMGNS